MSDNINSTEHPPTFSESPADNDNKKKKIIAGIIILLLLLIVGAVMLTRNNQNQTQEKILTLEQAKFKSDSLYVSMKKELASYKLNNEDLYTQLAEKEEKLEQYYVKIKRLISQAERAKSAKKTIEAKLQVLANEISTLKTYIDTQIKNIEELRLENMRLKAQKDSLEAAIAKSDQENTDLKNTSSTLKEENENLAQKVDEASVLRVVNISSKGFRVRNNGKRAEVTNAKRIEILETCFEIIENKITPEGVNRFYLRIIDPAGFTMQDRNRGSGRMTTMDNKRINHTVTKTFDYDPGIFSLCIEWASFPTTPFTEGTYTVEIYNKSRLVGSHNVTLK